MVKVVAEKARSVTQLTAPELMLVRRGDEPDPRLVELVRALARRAARDWRNQIAEERRLKRSRFF